MPKSIYESYKELLDKNNNVDNNIGMPSPEGNPEAFVKKGIKDREVEAHISYNNSVLVNSVSHEEIVRSVEAINGKQKADELVASIWDNLTFSYFVHQKIPTMYPEFINGLTKEQKKLFAKSSKDALKVLKSVYKKDKQKEDMFKRLAYLHLFTGSVASRGNKKLENIRIIESILSEEKKKVIMRELTKYKPIRDMTFEEQVTHPLSVRVNELKSSIPAEVSANPELLNEYNDALDYADKNITLVKSKVMEEYCQYETDVSRVESIFPAKINRDNIQTYQEGVYNDLYKSVDYGNKQFYYVDPEKAENFNKLFNMKIEMSPATKEGLKKMLHKMDEMKLSKYAYDLTGEDGGKIYGHGKILKHRIELVNAIKEGEPNAIIAAKKQYEKTVKEMQELYDIARASFSQDTGLFPCNVDCTRNENVPWEFTSDVMTNSQINTAFLIYMNIKSLGRDIDDYVENPAKDYYSYIQNKVEPDTFTGIARNKNFSDSLDILLGSGEYAGAYAKFKESKNVPVMGVGRVMSAPAFLERDPNIQHKEFIVMPEYNKIWSNAFGNNNIKCGFLRGLTNTEGQRKMKLITLKNLLAAPDEARDINSMLGGLPATDMFGRVIGPAFDWKDYLTKNNIDYSGLFKRYAIMLKKVEGAGLSKVDCIEAMNDVTFEVLKYHIQDRNKASYKALEHIFLTLADNLPSDAPAELRAKLETSRAEYLHSLRMVAPKDYLSNVNFCVNLAEDGVVAGSSEFADAKKQLADLEKKYIDLLSAGRRTSEEYQDKLIDDVRDAMDAAREKITAYLNYKERQQKKGKRLNNKAQRRILAMKRALSSLEEVRYAVDDKAMELHSFIYKADTEEVLKQNEVKAKKTKEQLIEELKGTEINDPDFTVFITNLDNLNEEMTALMTYGEDGWIELDKEKMKGLIKKGTLAGLSLEKLIAKSKIVDGQHLMPIKDTLTALSEILSRDMETYRAYNPDKETMSFPTLLENARTYTLDVSGSVLKTVGGAQSSRIPMHICDSNGELKTGFFTVATYFDPHKKINELAAEVSLKCKKSDGKMMIKHFLDNYMQYLENNGTQFYNKADYAECLMKDIRVEGTTRGDISADRFMSTFAKVYNKTEIEILEQCGSDALSGLMEKLSSVYVHVCLNSYIGMKDNARLDIRNEAMSVVADLFGVPHIICRSKSMKLKTKDGKEVMGTFMENAKGIDCTFPGRVDFRADVNSLTGGSGTGLKDIADLQVIDYICGNPDRHRGNMFYSFENGKLVGVQGIDNDTSFGSLAPTLNDCNMMVSPKSMRVMSKSMADKIVNIKPGQLIFALRGRLDNAAISMSVRRLKKLQEVITKSREYFANKHKEITKGYIKEIADNNWENVNIAELTAGKDTNNYFVSAVAAVENIGICAGRTEKIDSVEVGNLNRATKGGIVNELKKTANIIEALEKAGIKSGELSTSAKEYHNTLERILKRVNDSSQMLKANAKSPEAIFGKFVSKADLESVRDAANRLYIAADNYGIVKNNELKVRRIKDKDKLQLKVASDVKNYADKSKVLDVNEQERAIANERQVKEQILKIAKAGNKPGNEINTSKNKAKGPDPLGRH